jgi:hypothetical protein
MQRIYTILKGNHLEWAREVPKQSDRPIKVYVTLQEDRSSLSAEFRRQKTVEILEKLHHFSISRFYIEMRDWNKLIGFRF